MTSQDRITALEARVRHLEELLVQTSTLLTRFMKHRSVTGKEVAETLVMQLKEARSHQPSQVIGDRRPGQTATLAQPKPQENFGAAARASAGDVPVEGAPALPWQEGR